jgi:hypothetical protein
MAYGDKPIGLRQVRITPIDPDTLALGSTILLPANQVLTFKTKQDVKKLRGNDADADVSVTNIAADWSLDHGGFMPLDAVAVLTGATLTTTGTTPNEVKTLNQKTTDSRKFFKIEGRAVNAKGASDAKIVYYYAICTSFEGEMKDGEYWVSKAGGEAIGHPSNSKVWDLIQEETAVALT